MTAPSPERVEALDAWLVSKGVVGGAAGLIAADPLTAGYEALVAELAQANQHRADLCMAYDQRISQLEFANRELVENAKSQAQTSQAIIDRLNQTNDAGMVTITCAEFMRMADQIKRQRDAIAALVNVCEAVSYVETGYIGLDKEQGFDFISDWDTARRKALAMVSDMGIPISEQDAGKSDQPELGASAAEGTALDVTQGGDTPRRDHDAAAGESPALFRVTNPGIYRMRNGEKAVVREILEDDSTYPCRGHVSGRRDIWTREGEWLKYRTNSLDLVAFVRDLDAQP